MNTDLSSLLQMIMRQYQPPPGAGGAPGMQGMFGPPQALMQSQPMPAGIFGPPQRIMQNQPLPPGLLQQALGRYARITGHPRSGSGGGYGGGPPTMML